MPLDFGVLWNKPAISSTDPAERDAALAMYKKGIDAAHALGSPRSAAIRATSTSTIRR